MPEPQTSRSALAPYVRILGRGPGRSRPLTREEAREAFAHVFAGETAPEAIGALLMLMRFRGETPPEVAGAVEAARETLDPGWEALSVDLDWPSYAAGRTRGAPLFLLSARLVAMSGRPVLMHGFNSHQNPVAQLRPALGPLGVAVAETPEQAAEALERDGIAYAPLEALSPSAFRVLRLRDVLGLRSCVNTVLRMLNPARAPAAVQGVFHPPYRTLQAEAGALLGEARITVIKGGGGEFERHPGKEIAVFGTRDGEVFDLPAESLTDATRRLHEPGHAIDPVALWEGRVSDPFAEAVVVGTAGLALWTTGASEDLNACERMAADLWAARPGAGRAA